MLVMSKTWIYLAWTPSSSLQSIDFFAKLVSGSTEAFFYVSMWLEKGFSMLDVGASVGERRKLGRRSAKDFLDPRFESRWE
jgi:hypothetical protein